jgi:adenylate cyclase
MTQANLKGILSRKNGISRLMEQALTRTQGEACVLDTEGAILLGTAQPKDALAYPILIELETVGWVKGTSNAEFIAQLLNQCIDQEINKKKLGSELLHQYREINLIYAFSEKLSSVLGLDTIASLILQEAGQIIRFSSGVVVYYEEDSKNMILKASAGNDFLQTVDWQREDGIFREIALNGKSEISRAPESVLPDAQTPLLLYASLRVRDRVLGAIVLAGIEAQEFSAADLKLLTTLAFQSAAAIESALLHEKATTQALKAQREKLVFDLAQKHPFFKKVLSIINSNLDDPLFSVEKLSKAMSLSPSQLQRRTLSLADRTPVQIIRELRLQKAKDLLRKSDMTVSEIAFQTGFNDPSYFTRLFTRETNLTPSDWKENPNAE